MRRVKMREWIWIGILLFSGCASGSPGLLKDRTFHEFSRAPLSGMIYTMDNRPCPGVRILREVPGERGREETWSDALGRFVIPDVPRGLNRITLSREGYETESILMDYRDPGQILYVRLTGLETLLELTETALDGEQWARAEELLCRAERLGPGDLRVLFLRAVLARGRGEIREAEAWLRRMGPGGEALPGFSDLFLREEEE